MGHTHVPFFFMRHVGFLLVLVGICHRIKASVAFTHVWVSPPLSPRPSSLSRRLSESRIENDAKPPKEAYKNLKRRQKPAQYICCSSTKELTRAVHVYVRAGDNVAEIGSALRGTSTAICDAVGAEGSVLLVDVKRNHPKTDDERRTTAMRREGDEIKFYTDRSTFVELDDFQRWRSALFFGREYENPASCTYDVLVVDVSSIVGNDLDLTSLSLLKEFIELNDNLPSSSKKCRVVIVKSASLHGWARRLVHAQRLLNGGTTSSKIKNRLKLDKFPGIEHTPPIIIGTVGVEEYRRTIPYVIRPSDVVIEVGCHFGTSTVELHKAASGKSSIGGCIGVDIGPKIVNGARKRYPNVPFEVANAWHTSDLLRLQEMHLPSPSGYDVVYVDVGGLSGTDGLLEAISLVKALEYSLEPRCIVIKSLCVRRLASCLVPFSEVWQNDAKLRSRIKQSKSTTIAAEYC